MLDLEAYMRGEDDKILMWMAIGCVVSLALLVAYAAYWPQVLAFVDWVRAL